MLASPVLRQDVCLHGRGSIGLWRYHGRRCAAGEGMSAPDGMVAAIARINGGRLAARNLKDFETTGLELISPWQF